MKRLRVLVTAPRALTVIGQYEEELQAAGCDVLERCPVERLEEEELLPLVGDIDGIICGDDRITSRVLDAAPRLRVISKWGIGLDSINVVEAKHRGIMVYNTPGAFNDPVADTVMGYILLFTRKLDQMSNDMRNGLWQHIPLKSLKECTLGIIGLGNIGFAVARRAAAFGMNIFGYTVDVPKGEDPGKLGINFISKEKLLSISDFVTLHINLNDNNHHFISMKELYLMKSTSVIINTSRGALIDENALIKALSDGLIAGAALDVFEGEPLDLESSLRNLKNVYLAPHNANSSFLAEKFVHSKCIKNLIEGLNKRSTQ